MTLRIARYTAIAFGLLWPVSLRAADALYLPAGTLGASLTRLAIARGVGLLYDPASVAHRRNRTLRVSGDTAQILDQLLAGSGLVYRKTLEGAYLVTPDRALESSGIAPAPANVPDILVIGLRTLNTDIRRRIDDIEPYMVFGSNDQVAKSQSQSLDLYLRDFVPANFNFEPLTQRPVLASGEALSQIGLRGLDTWDTLVLVDGRRLPSVPDITSFMQSNIEGLPIEGLDRIELLASTAGGIYGPGATGGVVNFVMKRNYRGLNLSVVTGVTQRGDAPYGRIGADGGFTSRDDRTRVSFSFSYSNSRGLMVADRNYTLDTRLTEYALVENLPIPRSSSINIVDSRVNSRTGVSGTLTLKPQYGGQSVGSNHSYLTIAAAGTGQQASDLLSHAGTFDLSLGDDALGGGQSLTANVKSIGGTLSLRHEFSDRVELFADLIGWKTKGTATAPYDFNTSLSLSATDTRNPFTDPIVITFPTKGLSGVVFGRDTTFRVTGGAIVRLPHAWSAEADISFGCSTRASSNYAGDYDPYPGLNPFTGAAALQQQIRQTPAEPLSYEHNGDTLVDGELRLSGPLVNLPGGRATLTTLAEGRSEDALGLEFDFHDPDPSFDETQRYRGQRQRIYSLYGELRAPLTSPDWSFWPLRGLELQGAIRQDWFRATYVSTSSLGPGPIYGKPIPYDGNVHSFTLGARVRPITGIMFRGSAATGSAPPNSQQLSASNSLVGFVMRTSGTDPERGNMPVPNAARVQFVATTLQPVRATTLSIGTVLSPAFLPGLRISVDYTWLKKTRVPYSFNGSSVTYILSHPDLFAGAIVRAPLTAADQALGYTGGALQRMLLATTTLASEWLKAVDLSVTDSVHTRIGLIGMHLIGSWQPVLRTRNYPGAPTVSLEGFYGTAPKVKGNVGLEWTTGNWGASADAQFIGRMKVDDVLTQYITQSDHMRAQFYLDGTVSHRFKMSGNSTLDLHIGVRDILDRRPPIYAGDVSSDSQTKLGYTLIADPRGRRFEVGANAHF